MKDRILETADRLFYLQGIRAVGVDTIAAEIGISKRTLYNHFPSKDALISAYLARRFVAPRPSDKSPVEQILGTFDSLERRFSAKDFRGCPFVNAVAELGEDRSVRKVAVAFKESRRLWFRDLLVQLGVAEAEALATQLALLVDGSIAQDLVRNDPAMARAAKEAATVLLRNAGVKVGESAAAHKRAAKKRPSANLNTLSHRRPCERRDPYAVAFQSGDVVVTFLRQQAPVVMGPCVRRDDTGAGRAKTGCSKGSDNGRPESHRQRPRLQTGAGGDAALYRQQPAIRHFLGGHGRTRPRRRELRRMGRQGSAGAAPHRPYLPGLFQHQADHLLRGTAAVRGRQIQARRSDRKVYSAARKSKGAARWSDLA